MADRRRTETSNFGVGRRESHDASAFYGRFHAPDLSDDETVRPPQPIERPFVCGDARHLDTVEDGSVALVVTSPPYFAGKQYEEELTRDGVPCSYLEYLQLLAEVFAECVRKLEPGGRIAVNVANLGRRPYRSLSADVIRILEDDLGLLLRGELIWQKAEGAAGSCAWGSYRRAGNPVLRDITERVIVASKGRFDRARSPQRRAQERLPHESTLSADDFMTLTLDVWSMPPESARRVGHPAPFPVELPEQLIRLYTYRDDLVLDPFMGSGSALVAAAQLGRRFVGYDLDPEYVDLAEARVTASLALIDGATAADADGSVPAVGEGPTDPGRTAGALAEDLIIDAGFVITHRARRRRDAGVTVDFMARDAAGAEWCFEVAGANTGHRGGLLRTDVAWRAVGRATALQGRDEERVPVVILSSHLPRPRSDGDVALRRAGPGLLHDVIGLFDPAGRERLGYYAKGGLTGRPAPGFWLDVDVDADLHDIAAERERRVGLRAAHRPAVAQVTNRLDDEEGGHDGTDELLGVPDPRR